MTDSAGRAAHTNDAPSPDAPRLPTIWEDPAVPVGLAPHRPHALLVGACVLWAGWVVALMILAAKARG